MMPRTKLPRLGVRAPGVDAMKIEQHHLDALKAAGACLDRLDVYSAGMDVSEITFNDALWVEENTPGLVAYFDLPLWTMIAHGKGYGDGYGYVYGDGYGDGYGYGYGFGDGYGYGHGYCDGYGYGCGSGDGYGSGDFY